MPVLAEFKFPGTPTFELEQSSALLLQSPDGLPLRKKFEFF